jgi:hypothetical protein
VTKAGSSSSGLLTVTAVLGHSILYHDIHTVMRTVPPRLVRSEQLRSAVHWSPGHDSRRMHPLRHRRRTGGSGMLVQLCSRFGCATDCAGVEQREVCHTHP